MRSDADFLLPLGRPYDELDPAAIDPGHLGFAGDLPADRSRRQMADIDRRADRALAGIKIAPDRVERGVFHDHDHDRGGEHRRQGGVLEAAREVLGLDEKGEAALGTAGYR